MESCKSHLARGDPKSEVHHGLQGEMMYYSNCQVQRVLGFHQVLASQAAGAIAKWLFTHKTYKGKKGTVYIGSNYPV